jgi:tetratricopeptide (TPR) repeat protein
MIPLLLAAQGSPEEEYKAKLAQISKTCASKHYSLGEYLTAAQMHLWAREQYNKVIEFDPEHEGARKKLGYKKGENGWENDPTAKIDANKKKDAEADKVRKSFVEKLESSGKDVSRLWSDLALFCRKSNMAKESTEAFRKAVEYDPGNAAARKELGYEKDAKGVWISRAERELRKEMKDGIGKEPTGAATLEQTEVEKSLGLAHTKRESAHFIIESPHLKDPQLADLLQHAEHAFAMYHKIVGEADDLFQGTKMDLVVLKDKSQHLRYIDAFHRGSPAEKELARKSSGSGGFPRIEVYQDTAPISLLEDWVIHFTAQDLTRFFTGGSHLWLEEGTAYHFTRLMKDSAAFTCVDLAGTSPGAGEGKNLQDPANWQVILKVWIREGKDPNIDKVLKCTSLADFSGPDSIKAWSLVEFLLSEHHAKFLELCRVLKSGVNIEEGLKSAWAWTTGDLDQHWRHYVRSSY